MIASRITLDDLNAEQHMTAVATAVLGAAIYFWLSYNDDLSLAKVVMSAFWASLAYYAYALASNVRIDGIQSALVTLIGISVAAMILILTV